MTLFGRFFRSQLVRESNVREHSGKGRQFRASGTLRPSGTVATGLRVHEPPSRSILKAACEPQWILEPSSRRRRKFAKAGHASPVQVSRYAVLSGGTTSVLPPKRSPQKWSTSRWLRFTRPWRTTTPTATRLTLTLPLKMPSCNKSSPPSRNRCEPPSFVYRRGCYGRRCGPGSSIPRNRRYHSR